MKQLLSNIILFCVITASAAQPQSLVVDLEEVKLMPPKGGVSLYACKRKIFKNDSGEVDSLTMSYFGEFSANMKLLEDSVSIIIPAEDNVGKMDSSIYLRVGRHELAVANGEVVDSSVQRNLLWPVGTLPSQREGEPRLNAYISPCPTVKSTVDSLMFFNALNTHITIGNTYKAILPDNVKAEVYRLGHIPARYIGSVSDIWFHVENEPGYIEGTVYPEIYDGFMNKRERIFGDCIRLGDNATYRIDSINKTYTKLYLSLADSIRDTFYIPENVRLLLSPYLEKAKSENKLVLMDFWGTWCGPCIGAMPKIKEIEEKYHDRVITITLCVDITAQEERANQILDAKGISAIRLFEPGLEADGKAPISSSMNVFSMPTYILLKPNGEIILRGSGTTTLEYLTKLLDTRN